jgi:prepilin-type processing-associated H-X9-DG protein
MSGSPPENGPPRWQFSLGRLLMLPVVVAAVFAPIAAFGIIGIPLGVLIGWLALGIWFRLRATTIIGGFLFLVLLFMCLSPPVSSHPRAAAKRAVCMNNLKQIGIALESYHATYGRLPPAYIADKNGKPMHSWRVLLLPYLDFKPLYDQYRFDEPWDGPNNRKLHSIAMPLYRCPSDTAGSQKTTSYVAVVGTGTAWPGPKPVKMSDITDGLAQTITVVEMANSGIHWMEPRDLDFATMPLTINPGTGKGISSKHVQGANAAFADGHVEFLSDGLSREAVRALLTIHGGERFVPSQDGDWQLAAPAKQPSPTPP